MKRAAIYTRVSTDEQAEKGYSLESQREACERYALDNHLQVVARIKDDYSGTKLNRPGLDQIRDKIAQGEIDAVIVYSSDRWTRNLAHSLILREELLKADIELHYVNRGKIEDTPESRMMSNIEGVFDEYWREKIIEGCKRGRNKKARSNRIVLTGNGPYGYRKVGKRETAELVIHEQESNVVKQIFEWYVMGENGSGPLSLRGIANKLNELGVAVPASKKKRAICWHPFTVRFILTNEMYIGRTYYGKLRVINGERIKQPKEKWIPIDVPNLAFIDPDIFSMVQQRARRNSEKAKRNQKWDYLLSGHFRCGHCGYTVNGTAKRGPKNPTKYYRCGASARTHIDCEISNRAIRANRIDKAVWDWLVNLVCDDDALKNGLKRMVQQKESELEPLRRRLEIIDDVISKIDGKMKRLMDILGDEEDETIAAMRTEELRRLSKQKGDLIKERQAIESEMADLDITNDDQEQILEFARAIRNKVIDPDYENRRWVLDALDVQVRLLMNGSDPELGVKCRIPLLKGNHPMIQLDGQDFELIALSPL